MKPFTFDPTATVKIYDGDDVVLRLTYSLPTRSEARAIARNMGELRAELLDAMKQAKADDDVSGDGAIDAMEDIDQATTAVLCDRFQYAKGELLIGGQPADLTDPAVIRALHADILPSETVSGILEQLLSSDRARSKKFGVGQPRQSDSDTPTAIQESAPTSVPIGSPDGFSRPSSSGEKSS